jgi:hypothetical protein
MNRERAAQSVHAAKLPRWLLLAVAGIFVFIAGLSIPYARSVRLDGRLRTTTRALTVARLQNVLATAALEARRGRYESARRLASDFFTRLQAVSAELLPDARDEVRGVLAHRDSTITLLSRGVPASADLLDRVLAAYGDAVRAAGGAHESPTGRPVDSGGGQ